MWFSVFCYSVLTSCLIYTSTYALNNIEKAILDRHNYYRKLHGVPPLKYSASISKISKNYANYLANRDLFRHSGNKKYGENLYKDRNTDRKYIIHGKAPVTLWYSEIKNYKSFKMEPTFSNKTKPIGHFTQVIWKGSREIGIGVVRKTTKKDVRYFIVCNYHPPGNVVSQFRKNVFPPKH